MKGEFIVQKTSLLVAVAILAVGFGKGGNAFASKPPTTQQAEQTLEKAVTDKLAMPMAEGLMKALGADDPNVLASWGTTELHMAAGMGKVDRVKALLKDGAKVDARDKRGQTPLHAIVVGFRDDCMPALLAAGAKVNAQDLAGRTPLHYAAERSNDDCVYKLLAAGGDVNIRDLQGETPLILALYKEIHDRRDARIQRMLAAKADVSIADKNGSTPLHAAASGGNQKAAEAIIRAGAKVDAVDKYGYTPLLYAAENGWHGTIGSLRKAGADIGARNKDGWSALALSAESCYPDVYSMLKKAGVKEDTWTPLHHAAIEADPNAVKKLIAAKADLNAKDRYGRTPLIWAANCDPNIALAILVAGADAKPAGADGLTALHMAAREGFADVAKALIAAKADTNARDEFERTPLHLAAREMYAGIVSLLLAAKADVNARDIDGETPLLTLLLVDGWSGESKDPDAAVKALLAAGADPLVADDSGRSPESVVRFSFRKLIEPAVAAAVQQRITMLLDRYSREGTIAPKANTPEGAVRRVAFALYGGHRKMFLDCFNGDADGLEMLGVLFDMFRAQASFLRAMTRTYGQDAWSQYCQGDGVRIQLPRVDLVGLESPQCAIDGDKASCPNPLGWAGYEEFMLVRAGGKWRLNVPEYVNPSAKPKDVTPMLKGWTAALAAMTKRVGEPGLKPADFASKVWDEATAEPPTPQEIAKKMVDALGADDPKVLASWGTTELHIAASVGDAGRAKALLRDGEKVDARDKQGQTSLHVAARSERDDCIDVLLAAGADVNARDLHGRTPLHVVLDKAIEDSWHPRVQKLLAAKADPNVATVYGTQLLGVASHRGNAQAVEALIRAGAKVNNVHTNGWTALHAAARGGWDKVVKVLLKAGADVNARDKSGLSALAISADENHQEIYSLLKKAGAKEESWTPLHVAVIERDANAVRDLIAAGADLNACDCTGQTPLIWAANWDPNIGLALIAAGADVNVGAKNWTALHTAAQRGFSKLVEALIVAKADVNARDKCGGTPLSYAAMYARPEEVAMLLAAGAEVDARFQTGRTPLGVVMLAAAQSVSGEVVTTYAKQYKDLTRATEVVKLLLDAGADPLAADQYGWFAANERLPADSDIRKLVEARVAVLRPKRFEILLDRYCRKDLPAPDANTPDSAVLRVAFALYGGDRKMFLESFTGDSDGMELVGALFDSTRALAAFYRAMTKAYGRDAWREYQKADGVKTQLPSVDISVLDAPNFKIYRNRACGPCPFDWAGFEYLLLARSGETWRLTVPESSTEIKDITALTKGVTATVSAMTKRVGKPGLKPADFASDAWRKTGNMQAGPTTK